LDKRRGKSFVKSIKGEAKKGIEHKKDRVKRVENSKPSNEGLIRLNKFIANAGVCSRREADKYIESGVVSVNSKIVTQLGYKVKPTDKVQFEGQTLKRERFVYVLLNKPKGFITSTSDPFERKTVMSLVANATKERIYPVGRLDKNTTGVLLFTNDGDIAKKLTHPSHRIKKIYHVVLNKALSTEHFTQIQNGLKLEDGFIKPDALAYADPDNKREIGIELHSGKNRIVRRIFEHLEYKVDKLDRVKIGSLTKKNLSRGKWRILSPKEIDMLKILS
jgi:23S rRNA pseudouridine2605 synthase